MLVYLVPVSSLVALSFQHHRQQFSGQFNRMHLYLELILLWRLWGENVMYMI
jgi:hypothetical protein